ncbi:MAG: alpha-mannosidase [Caldilineaceae bacterium]|nr:alpha-mannosidase [Caldilineaceae bacterium]
MPTFKPYTTQQLDYALRQIEGAIYTVVAPLAIRAWWSREPLPFSQRQEGAERQLAVGDQWGTLFDCAWFHFTGTVPPTAAGHRVVLLLDVNGELCVVDEAGVPARGLTNVASEFDYRLGRPGKRVWEIAPQAAAGAPISVWADGGHNDLFGRVQGEGRIVEAAVAICHDEVRALYYDFEVLLDFLKVLPTTTPRYQQILTGLTDVAHLLYQGIQAQASTARARLAPLLAKRGGDPDLNIHAVGHAHMDLAWLWPLRETIRKGARTFATVLVMLERYPDYVFAASQPQLYQWMKEHYPALYAKIKAQVQAGRIEAQGAMWVEPDVNVTGGEALVRQILEGKRFFCQEFGVAVNYGWLPDVFGYNAALPQILKLAGLDYFSTQKLSWSLINAFPHHAFHWQGIDGTTVLVHMLPEETYNSPAAPRSVRKIEENYQDKGISDHALMIFGIGDGGGGPGEEHLERLARIQNLAGLSPVTQAPTAAFFPVWAKDADRFPTWVGELYLERHQGTLTTQARNKWYNRKAEIGLREWEWAAAMTQTLTGVPYPSARLQSIWREILLYQFHDILPGSSIKRVYDESVPRYQALLDEVTAASNAAKQALADQVDTTGLTAPVVIFNSLSWPRAEWVAVDQGWLPVTVPPMGYTTVDASQAQPTPLTTLHASSQQLENELLRVTFAANGSIVSLYDKRVDREVIPPGQAANQLAVYVDLGDAWDFPMDYAEQRPRLLELTQATARVEGPYAVVEQHYRLGYSTLVQKIALTAGSPQLTFTSHLHWRERQSMLRTSFPVAVHAESATYEIQFGHVQRPTHRNTTWDLARDEVAGHKWVDLSQRDYGVALLNDAKYGHKIKGNVIDLNLLRSVPHPGPRLVADEAVAPGEPHPVYTDQGEHHFTYALYPHPDDAIAGGVIQAAYALNYPLSLVPISSPNGTTPQERAFFQLSAPNLVIEAVKQAEESTDLIVRLYEASGQQSQAQLRFGFAVSNVWETNLMEEDATPLPVDGNTVALVFRPFEIKTLKISRFAS